MRKGISRGLPDSAARRARAVKKPSITLPVRDSLAALTVADESSAGYPRDRFKHFTDADKNGCNTRAEVLLEEVVASPKVGAKCALSGGSWYSPHDDSYLDSASKLDVDHLVPLAEAWDSGASTWTPKEREANANDLDDPILRRPSAVGTLPVEFTGPSTPCAGSECSVPSGAVKWPNPRTDFRLTGRQRPPPNREPFREPGS
ncbi:HNH endonuclease [Streptomyces sp. NPDC054813]